jgi:phospholipid-transporting ATPase
MLNSQESRQKMSHLESKINTLVIFVIVVQLVISLIASVVGHMWQIQDNLWDDLILNLEQSPAELTTLNYFTYFLLMNTLLPISLQVTLEVVKVVQAYFIQNDVDMFSWERYKLPIV